MQLAAHSKLLIKRFTLRNSHPKRLHTLKQCEAQLLVQVLVEVSLDIRQLTHQMLKHMKYRFKGLLVARLCLP